VVTPPARRSAPARRTITQLAEALINAGLWSKASIKEARFRRVMFAEADAPGHGTRSRRYSSATSALPVRAAIGRVRRVKQAVEPVTEPPRTRLHP
jgi:hypothetical protein